MQTDFKPFDWYRIFVGEVPLPYYAELGLKIVVVFVLLVVVMRILGKTGRDHLSPLQQMLLIALGSAAGDVMLYDHVPFGHAALILLGLSGLAVALEFATTKSSRVRDIVDSRPVVLAIDGRVLRERLHSQRINERELYAAIREHGGRALCQVQLAVLEVTGRISVFLDESVEPATEDLLEYLRRDALGDTGASASALAPAES